MKKLYKRIFAVVLCLALMAAIVPATAFALERMPGKIVSGKFDLKLYEPYFGDINELFPEVGIAWYLDQRYLTAEDITNPKDTGMYFTVCLAEDTCEAVVNAIAALEGNPLVEYARPFYCYVDGRIMVCFNEPYEGDVTALFPDVAIESVRESTENIRVWAERNGKELTDTDKARVNKEFTITLVDKSAESLLNALNKMENCDCETIESIRIVELCYYPGSISFAIETDPIEPEDEITVGDALKALRVAAGLQEATAELVAAYDTDGDGEITVADALTVLRIAAKLA
ncbi:MAG: hypothetical protein IJU94_07030 [Clostridia bacterium]|nr:hypothetical protein [Clostridia bacterium]